MYCIEFRRQSRGLDSGGTHVVAHTPYGRAAILLLPNTAADGAAAVRVAHQGLVAAVFRAPRGVVSVVADSAAKAGSVEQLFRRTAGWDG